MGLIKLNASERKLFTDVEHGDRTELAAGDEPISAEVLRHIMLGLPLVERFLWAVPREGTCRTTGAGISLVNATIAGPLRLNAAIGCHGGPLCPLEFANCTFKAGFHAPHAHFSRLSFRDCTFEDSGERTETGAWLPVIDLTGARLDSHLDMGVVRPGADEEAPLWIRAVGVCVGGGINLARSSLRAPYKPAVTLPDGSTAPRVREDALDLTLANIAGDLSLDGGISVRGRLKLRGSRVGGDMWLDEAALAEPGEDGDALLLQGACIRGFLSMCYPDGPRADIDWRGHINLVASEIGRSLILKKFRMQGDLVADDLIVRDDFTLHTGISGKVRLVRASIGGSVDISELQIEQPGGPAPRSGEAEAALSLKDGKISGALRLTTKRTGASPLKLAGVIDLTGLTCDMLDDELGQRWGKDVRILMNHFTYARSVWPLKDRSVLPRRRRRRKRSQTIFADWLLSNRADGNGPFRWLPRWALPSSSGFWNPWQLRRNWIYQQYDSAAVRVARHDPYLSIARHKFAEEEFHPQPFEQAIKVARAEGREDFATQFEMHKQFLEWKFFNQNVRWPLALTAITLGGLWLTISRSKDLLADIATILALALTIVLMISGSALRKWLRRRIAVPLLQVRRVSPLWDLALVGVVLVGALNRFEGWSRPIVIGVMAAVTLIALILWGSSAAVELLGPKDRRYQPTWVADKSSKLLTWAVFWTPAAVLVWAADWIDHPFHYIIALLIFLAIRLAAALTHQLIRFGFGYLRQPIRAVVTLIAAFLIGWWGVSLAKSRDMFVIAAGPVADSVALVGIGSSHDGEEEFADRMGSRRTAPEASEMDLSCAHEISEPLYALDVLVPIVDLGEESRCEVRRFASPKRPVVWPDDKGLGSLWSSLWDLPLNDNRFWWWMKAVYAIAGWVLVSLALLTFAQVNRTHGEPAE